MADGHLVHLGPPAEESHPEHDHGAGQAVHGAVPPQISKALNARIVPPDNSVGISTRRKSRHEKSRARKGVEPIGENLLIWKSKQRMQEMFVTGKLLRGAGAVDQSLQRKLPGENLSTTPGLLKNEEKLLPESEKIQQQLNPYNFENEILMKLPKIPPKSDKILNLKKIFEVKTGFEREKGEGSAISKQFCVQPIKSGTEPPIFGSNQQQAR